MANQTIGKHHGLEFEAMVFFVNCISCPLEYFGLTCLANCAINKPDDVFTRCSKHSKCISINLEHDWRVLKYGPTEASGTRPCRCGWQCC